VNVKTTLITARLERSVYLHLKICIFELFCEILWILSWHIEVNLLSELQLNVILIQSLENCMFVGRTTETKLVLWNDDCQVLWSCIRRVNTQQGLVQCYNCLNKSMTFLCWDYIVLFQ